MKTTVVVSALISRLAHNLGIDALPDSFVALSALKLRLAVCRNLSFGRRATQRLTGASSKGGERAKSPSMFI